MLVKLSPTNPWLTLQCEKCGRNFNSRFEDARICVCCVMRQEEERRAAKKRQRKQKARPQQKRQPRQKHNRIIDQSQTCQHCGEEFRREKIQPYCSNRCSGLGQVRDRRKHDYGLIRELHQQGLRGHQIKSQTGYSSATISFALKKMGLKANAHKSITGIAAIPGSCNQRERTGSQANRIGRSEGSIGVPENPQVS